MAVTPNINTAKSATQLLLFPIVNGDAGMVGRKCEPTILPKEFTAEEETLSPGTSEFELYIDVLDSFQFQYEDRFGGGTPYPSIPNSQRVYDGNNWYEYCESIL